MLFENSALHFYSEEHTDHSRGIHPKKRRSMAFGFLKQMLKSPGLSLLPLALPCSSISLDRLLSRVPSELFYLLDCSFSCLLYCLLSELFDFLRRCLGCLLYCLLSKLFDLLDCSFSCLLSCLLSELFDLLGRNLGRLLCCLLRRRLGRIHFHLIEREWNAEEVHVGIQRRAHHPLESLLLIRNKIP